MGPKDEPGGMLLVGPCCNCGRADGVRNVLMLDRRGAMPGMGWGCIVCDLPFDGAVAVLCDDCVDVYPPKFVCAGYPASGARVRFDELPPGEFAHDPVKHAEDDG